jgi:hypothetical protein
MTDNNTTKELLLSSLISFYSNNNNYKSILKIIIDGKHELSLRMIDWLVTRYAKNNNIIYWINENDDNIYYNLPDNYSNEKYRKINLYLDYRAQLKSFKKFNFDAFRRHERITFYIGDKTSEKINEENDYIETTIGQLNFFKWAFNNKIITYALQNQKNIYENMSKFSYKKQITNKYSLIPKQDIINTKCFVRFD